MKNNSLLIWASDLSKNTGEGILSRAFIAEISKLNIYKKVKIKTLEQEISVSNFDLKSIHLKEVSKTSLFHRYYGPIYGAIYLLLNSRSYTIIYLNYLPLWNFLLFFILPRKTILGPITGGIYKNPANNLNLIIRKYFFPIFYRISMFVIFKKFKKIIFSTSILKLYTKKNSLYLFDFVILLFKKNFSYPAKHKRSKNKYDIIFYNRNHATKKTANLRKILIFLSSYCKICVVGDIFEQEKIKNFGWVERDEVCKLIRKSKLAFNSTENFLSIFGIDCINNGIPVIYDQNLNLEQKFQNHNYIPINFDDIKKSCSQILKLISKNNKKPNSDFWKSIKIKKINIRKFIYSYLQI
jgi:hypothetical protein